MDVLEPTPTDYSSVKLELNKAKRETSTTEKLLASNTVDLETAVEDLDNLGSLEGRRLEDARGVQEKEHINRILAPHREKLNRIRANQSEAKRRYDEEMRNFEDETLLTKYMEPNEVFDEVGALLGELEKAVADSLGEDFKAELILEVNKVTPRRKISVRKLESLRSKLEILLKDMEGSKGVIEPGIIDNIKDFLGFLDSDEGVNGEWRILFIAFLSLGAVFLSKYIAPIFTVALTGLFIADYYRHTKLFGSLLLLSSISNNLTVLEEESLAEARRKRSKAKEEYVSSYLAVNKSLSEKEELALSAITIGEEKAKLSFRFDDREIMNGIESMRVQKKTRIDELKKTVDSLESELKERLKRVEDLTQKLSDSVEYTKKQYLDFSEVGESFLLDSSFLLDIKESGQPIIWNFPETNILVISNDESDYVDFTGLMVSQLRNRISPFALKITIVDIKTAGVPYQHLMDNERLVGRIVTSEKDFRDLLLTLIETQESRIPTILREFDGMYSYNSCMLGLDSVAESYHFYFVQVDSESLISDPLLERLLNVCWKVGIFFIFYMKESDLTGCNSSYDFINRIQNFYVIEAGQIGKWAKSFVEGKLGNKGSLNAIETKTF